MTLIDDIAISHSNHSSRHRVVVALEHRLRSCKNVITLGVRPNFDDYSTQEAALIHGAQKVYYPSRFYAELFAIMGKQTFPNYRNYLFAQDKIKQTALFQLQKIPHPRTRLFYGNKQKMRILSYFNFPMVAKIPRGSAMGRGVYLIENQKELEQYCRLTHIAYIQEYLPIKHDFRVVVIGKQVVHAYLKIPRNEEFRANLALGAKLCFDTVPQKALELAQFTAIACDWDDVGIDICEYQGNFYVLEANMKYGKQGFYAAGIDYTRLMESLIDDGKI
jgi:ribosomal protein S6--L-glutamate ligase